MERLIWNEYDGDDEEAEALVDRLDDCVSEEALYEDFTAEPVEVHIARLCAELGLADSTGGAIPAPEAASTQADDADDYWRSSA
ncbi:MAG: hypothetical protein JWQ29_978 [Phenylobacterium sp.]|nr:hypothetical protein [Phenylobacterium sp.]